MSSLLLLFSIAIVLSTDTKLSPESKGQQYLDLEEKGILTN
jgi:hypothetical protein